MMVVYGMLAIGFLFFCLRNMMMRSEAWNDRPAADLVLVA
jgi:hypothetical protein